MAVIKVEEQNRPQQHQVLPRGVWERGTQQLQTRNAYNRWTSTVKQQGKYRLVNRTLKNELGNKANVYELK